MPAVPIEKTRTGTVYRREDGSTFEVPYDVIDAPALMPDPWSAGAGAGPPIQGLTPWWDPSKPPPKSAGVAGGMVTGARSLPDIPTPPATADRPPMRSMLRIEPSSIDPDARGEPGGPPRQLRRLYRGPSGSESSPAVKQEGASGLLQDVPGGSPAAQRAEAFTQGAAPDAVSGPTEAPTQYQSPEDQVRGSVARQQESERAIGEIEAQRATAVADATRNQAEFQQRTAEDYLKRREDNKRASQADADNLSAEVQQIRATKLNPDQWWQDKSALGKVGAAIGAFIGGYLSAGRGPNQFMTAVNGAIQRNLAGQRDNLANRWEAYREKAGLAQRAAGERADDLTAWTGAQAMIYQSLADKVRAEGLKYDSPILQQRHAQAAEMLEMQGNQMLGQMAQQKFDNRMKEDDQAFSQWAQRKQIGIAGGHLGLANRQFEEQKRHTGVEESLQWMHAMGLDASAWQGKGDPVVQAAKRVKAQRELDAMSVNDHNGRRVAVLTTALPQEAVKFRMAQASYNSARDIAGTMLAEYEKHQEERRSLGVLADKRWEDDWRVAQRSRATQLRVMIVAAFQDKISDKDIEQATVNVADPATWTSADPSVKLKAWLELADTDIASKARAVGAVDDNKDPWDPAKHYAQQAQQEQAQRALDVGSNRRPGGVTELAGRTGAAIATIPSESDLAAQDRATAERTGVSAEAIKLHRSPEWRRAVRRYNDAYVNPWARSDKQVGSIDADPPAAVLQQFGGMRGFMKWMGE